MKRRIRKLCVFLLLGAIFNVAVAWAISLVTMWRGWNPASQAASIAYWPASVPADWPSPQHAYQAHVFGWTMSGSWADVVTSDEQGRAVESHSFSIDEHALGWPLMTLTAERWSEYFLSASSTVRYVTDGHPPPSVWREGMLVGSNHKNLLPLRPLWPGFAINTIFYAAILWLLFAFPFVMRRQRRRKLGLCLTCGYPIGTSGVCTECGKRLK